MEVKEFGCDVEQIRPIVLSWKTECDKSFGIETDEDIYMAKLQEFADEPGNALLVLGDDTPVGYMGLTTFVSPMGRQLVASEHYWYVIPEKRGISALKFIPYAQQWARKKGCSHIMMSASNFASDLHDRTCEIYKKFGMRKFETTYIKRV